jgi:hypothetical protein
VLVASVVDRLVSSGLRGVWRIAPSLEMRKNQLRIQYKTNRLKEVPENGEATQTRKELQSPDKPLRISKAASS